MSNTFAESIRYLSVDADAFEELCAMLSELAERWRDARTIDKELVCDLYGIVKVTEYGAESMSKSKMKGFEKAADMALRLDDLVTQCFCAGCTGESSS